jgi:beta-lactamase class D
MILKRVWLALLALTASISVAEAKTICTLLQDAGTGAVLREEGDCGRRVTAASTFKIAISLMGYDSGFLVDEHTPVLPFREGYPDGNPAWRASTDPTRWIAKSVVWYSQQVTKSLGKERFRRYVEAFGYGNRDVSGDPGKDDGLTNAWLSSSLKISPREQAAFLRAVVNRTLPVSAHAYAMTQAVTAIATLPGGWDVHGKTGAGAPRTADGAFDGKHAYGWFVGWATKEGRSVLFVRLIQNDGGREAVSPGQRARAAFMKELPRLLPR